jgi:hypothetical protein
MKNNYVILLFPLLLVLACLEGMYLCWDGYRHWNLFYHVILFKVVSLGFFQLALPNGVLEGWVYSRDRRIWRMAEFVFPLLWVGVAFQALDFRMASCGLYAFLLSVSVLYPMFCGRQRPEEVLNLSAAMVMVRRWHLFFLAVTDSLFAILSIVSGPQKWACLI